MRKFISVILMALMAASVMAASAPVSSEQVVNATGQDGSYLYVYEEGLNANGFLFGDKAIIYKVDTGNISNLNNFSLGLFAGCDAGQNDWDNCITSIHLGTVAGSCVGVFDGTSYGGTRLAQFGSRTYSQSQYVYWEGSSKDNKASSIKWGDWKYVASSSGYQCVYGSY